METRGAIFGCTVMQAMDKVKRLEAFRVSGLREKMERHTMYHWSTTLEGYRLEFWPTTGKWRWKDKNYWGSLTCFENFLRKRGWHG